MFINCSNHPSAKWSEAQLAAARQHGDIIDIQFPNVPPTASIYEVEQLAENSLNSILSKSRMGDIVLVQGEATLQHRLVTKLKDCARVPVAACSDRKSVEQILPDGTTQKTSVFEFVQFREY